MKYKMNKSVHIKNMISKFIYRIVFFLALLNLSLSQAQINPSANFIGVDVSTSPQNVSFNYDSCFTLGANLGMKRVGVFQNWTSIETSSHVFNMTLFDIANYYYPAYNMPIDLTIAPIATNHLEVPSDLTTTAFDDPAFINRFEILLDSVKLHIPNITLASLVIGSEHDIYLGTNATLWVRYTTFYNSVSAYAKTLWPGLKVATELTFTGITTQPTFTQTLNTNSDYIGVSYYPLNNDFTVKPVSVIPTDFATLVGLYPSKPLCFYQYGYPSGTSCNSSETQQAQFISQTFTSWDAYATNIKMIDFTWLHDLDTAVVNYYGSYYGITDTVFLEYLHTLGLRTWNGSGTDKPAFLELECQAKQHGYNNLNVVCSTKIDELINENDLINIYPNPNSGKFNLTINNFNNTQLNIYNVLGECVYKHSNTFADEQIELHDQPNGIYFITIKIDQGIVSKKMIINK